MAKGKKSTSKKDGGLNAGDFGPLKPEDGDRKIDVDEDPMQIISEVQLTCDDNTGVFFFRFKRALFLRVVEFQ